MDLDEIFALSADVLRDLAGVPMTIRRGDASIEDVAVVKCNGRTSRLVADDVPIVSDRLDLCIDPDAYDFGAGPVRPEKGDRFEHVLRGQLVTYVASAGPDNASCWRWSDEEARIEYRIHVRLDDESDDS